MAGKAKFDKDAAFRTIVGRGDLQDETTTMHTEDSEEDKTEKGKSKNKGNRVQRSYWLDKDIDKALKRRSLEEETTLTELINEILRTGLSR